jgi:hypothetical protein
MGSLRNVCFTIALVALGFALFLFARGLTTYAYISAVIVPLAAMMAIVFQPDRGGDRR